MKFNPNYQITARLTKHLLEIERHKEAIDILPVTANLIASLRETARLQSTHYSTQIEGNALTQEQVQKVVKEKKGGFPGRERDEREVKNYFLALEYVEDELKNDADFSKKLIQSVHSLAWKGTNRLSPYRKEQNIIRDGSSGVIVYMPPEGKDVDKLMKNLVDWTREIIDNQEAFAPIIAGLVHYQFATIHPYYDGNGRTARLLTTFVLHKMGYDMKGIYSLEEYYAKNLQGYYHALDIGDSYNYYGGREKADITPFLDYFLEGMVISFKSVREKAQLLNDLDCSIGETRILQTDKLRELRPQQRQILLLFVKTKETSLQEIANHLGLKSRNAHSLVKKWIYNNFVQIANEPKRTRTYMLTKQWEQLILSTVMLDKLDDDIDKTREKKE